MIEEARGRIDYDEFGTGATIVLVPGSCSTGAAWRPMIAHWNGEVRWVTTSLLGYGGTAERRTAHDPSISHEAEMLESVILRAGGPVHLVGHSFGGLVSLAVALRNQVDLASLVVIEAPAVEALRDNGDLRHYHQFRKMTDAYFAAFGDGDLDAIATMIDFYGGAGTFAAFPPPVRGYAVATTPVNILDWASAYGFSLPEASLAALELPALVLCGGASHPAVRRANALLSQFMRSAALVTVEGASHFMIATHATQISQLIAEHVNQVELAKAGSEPFASEGERKAQFVSENAA
jgi:pimeloyl-ACP methyl ester carboxylesterase